MVGVTGMTPVEFRMSDEVVSIGFQLSVEPGVAVEPLKFKVSDVIFPNGRVVGRVTGIFGGAVVLEVDDVLVNPIDVDVSVGTAEVSTPTRHPARRERRKKRWVRELGR